MIKRSSFRDTPFFDAPGVSEYTDPADSMKIGDRPLDAISYVYFNNKLFHIAVSFRNDRACGSARGIVPAVEEQYQLRMTVYTPPTQLDLFVARAEPGDLRIVSLCRRDSVDGSWVSQLTFDHMPTYRAVSSADESVRRNNDKRRIEGERKGF
ncbi:hypothetical protein RA280_14565 [Cupriavidus sp. CV2]|uniref:hypothetical protein n=1 Tax=Cupriavidus ulmosensis TaxID=3065913 RepID=UPI00296AE57C|nr:hypothetical protein [Cupriavidus sp. CV2]MDW3682949.1 hypothetical protein [Cupriavidus sp. CV2]